MLLKKGGGGKNVGGPVYFSTSMHHTFVIDPKEAFKPSRFWSHNERFPLCRRSWTRRRRHRRCSLQRSKSKISLTLRGKSEKEKKKENGENVLPPVGSIWRLSGTVMGAAIAAATKRKLMMVVNCILMDLIWIFYILRKSKMCV